MHPAPEYRLTVGAGARPPKGRAGSRERSTNWAPAECTLPTAEQPLRVAEFDALFAGALRGHQRLAPTHLRLRLDGAGGWTPILIR
ncbi:hypothetical protein [Streptosporangium roseum]|uniref:Uncharacterized protein n=1 Tax=Streptosporangium roseum (strain ATCC 12428 / DSM 43021 / JCM 3005 / KCTC 9067 / NCIMB 10171 / NRRL 2505 / NI 9100) TaxID=479432 RepID=D2B8F9_STRRD|nr:hypothetical protein [Streptosporangium roseum]ACZ87769.1 hypothetical protein Sros_4969 [Streptosporangium roseum DSM 43021]